MIQTKQPISYEDRGDKESILLVEIDSFKTTKEGTTYLVHDWVFVDGVKTIHNAKEVFYPNAQMDAISAYIDANNDFTGLTKTQREWAKIKIALMLDTQTNLLETGKTIYKLTPQDWEFSI